MSRNRSPRTESSPNPRANGEPRRQRPNRRRRRRGPQDQQSAAETRGRKPSRGDGTDAASTDGRGRGPRRRSHRRTGPAHDAPLRTSQRGDSASASGKARASTEGGPSESDVRDSAFARFGLDPVLLRSVASAGFESPRPIQSETIPSALAGEDVLGLAETGTGKTAAFALPILERFLRERGPGPRALILAPTRELANQIAAEHEMLARFTRISVTTVFGGVSQRRQVDALRRRPEIVVGCPGRVLDLLQQRLLKLDGIETLVLDEADHMFDLGFLPSIRRIVAALPERRQNLLFSATMPKEIRSLADGLLVDPHVVDLAGRAPASTIDHALYLIPETAKRDLLGRVLDADQCTSAIVFTRTKARARRLAETLGKQRRRAVALQGNMSQSQRDRAMKGFRQGRYDILVATDIAARGIDVSSVSHVINFDVPNTPEAYTHRIGRTGRSEREGIALTFVTGADHGWLRATERRIGSRIERIRAEGIDPEPERQGDSSKKGLRQRGSGAGSAPRGGSGGGRRRQRSRRAPASRIA